MEIFDKRPALRWAAPVAAVGLVAAGSFVTGRAASADPTLPPVSARQLLVDVQKAEVDGMSGTVVQTSNLGLPEIPGMTGGSGGDSGGSSSLTSMVSGTHTLRLWYGGPGRQRLALVGGLGESDVVRDGPDLWVWSSTDKTAQHMTLPRGEKGSNDPMAPGHAPGPGELPSTPEQAATRALDLITPTTRVTTSGDVTVAGRSAYELTLTPKDSTTLVDRVTIAVDAATHVPLRVQVYSTRMADPAFEVGFSSVDFTTPDARQFSFNPPPGTKVTEKSLPIPGGHDATGRHGPMAGAGEPTVVGSGWASVAVGDLSQVTGLGTSGGSGPPAGRGDTGLGELGQVLGSLPKVSGPWGSGRLLNGTLFSAVLTDDGRVAVGAVAPDRLYAALSR